MAIDIPANLLDLKTRLDVIEKEFENFAKNESGVAFSNENVLMCDQFHENCFSLEKEFFKLTEMVLENLRKCIKKMESIIESQSKIVSANAKGRSDNRRGVMCRLNARKGEAAAIESALDSAFYTKLTALMQEIESYKIDLKNKNQN